MRAGGQSSLGGAVALGSGACSGLFLAMGRTWTASPLIPLTLYSLRGEGGEVLPFTAVNPEPRGSPARSLSMKLGVLVRGACRTAGMIGGRPRQRVWLEEGEECVRWARVDQNDVLELLDRRLDRNPFTAALGPSLKRGGLVSLKSCDTGGVFPCPVPLPTQSGSRAYRGARCKQEGPRPSGKNCEDAGSGLGSRPR